MSSQKTIHIQGEMSQETLSKVDSLKERLGENSRMSVVASSVSIADTITKIINSGGRVILEDKNGKKSTMNVRGLHAV